MIRILKSFKRNWFDLLSKYESSFERCHGHGGIFDQVLDHIRDEKNIESINFEEAAETMAEIIFAYKDVLQPALVWLLADLVIYPKQAENLVLPKAWETIDKSTLDSKYSNLLNLLKKSAYVRVFFVSAETPKFRPIAESKTLISKSVCYIKHFTTDL